MKGQCKKSSNPCTVLEQIIPLCFICHARMMYCFLSLSFRIQKGARHRRSEVKWYIFAFVFPVPRVNICDFRWRNNVGNPPLWQFNWNSEHLKYVQSTQTLHFLHHSYFISSSKCFLGRRKHFLVQSRNHRIIGRFGMVHLVQILLESI